MKLLKLCLMSAALVCAIFALSGLAPVTADPPSWADFSPAEFYGLEVNSATQGGLPGFQVSLYDYASITIGSQNYKINWIQAFFMVGKDKTSDWTATEDTIPTDWRWETKATPGRISGWVGTGGTRVWRPTGSTPNDKLFLFNTLSYDPDVVLFGFHVGYSVDGTPTNEYTAWYKGTSNGDEFTPPDVPEAGMLIHLIAAGASGMILFKARRRA